MLRIQEGVESIGGYAFRRCAMFTEVHIPASVTTIGDSAFCGCTRISALKWVPASEISLASGFISSGSSLRVYLSGENDIISGVLDNLGIAWEYLGDMTYTLMLIPNGGVLEVPDQMMTMSWADELILPEPARNGYIFTGWYQDNELAVQNMLTRMPAKDLTLFAGWTAEKDIFHPESSVLTLMNGEETFEQRRVFWDEDLLPMPEPVMSGKVFLGWTWDEAGTMPFELRRMPEMDITLFAQWTDEEAWLPDGRSLLTLCANGSVFENGSDLLMISLTQGASVSGALPEISWEHHVFRGWYLDAEGNNIWRGISIPLNGLTLYAGWTEDDDWLPEGYSLVTLNGCGGLFDEGNVLVLQLPWDTPMDSLPLPVFTGHTFSGWYTDEEHTRYFDADTLPSIPLTLWAGWDLDCNTVTLHTNGGIMPGNAEEHLLIHVGDTVIIPWTPSRTGFTFTGWFLDSMCTMPFDGVMPARDMDLFASWAATSLNGRYSLEGDHATLLSYTLISEEGKAVYLPETVEGFPLTAIAADAFCGSAVQEIWLPSGLISLDIHAFRGASQIRAFHVHPDNTVLSAENGILYTADGITLLRAPNAMRTVIIPSHAKNIGSYAFDGIALESVRIQPGVTSIGAYAFHDTCIQSVNLPATLVAVEDYAFAACSGLRLIRAEGNINEVSENAFADGSAFQLFYGPVGDNFLRRAAMNVKAYYNRYLLTLYLPEGQARFAREAGAGLSIPTDFMMPENSVLAGWYLDEEKTIPLTDENMPATDLVLYAGTLPAFETAPYETTDGTTGLTILSTRLTGDVAIPSVISGIPVLAIASEAFGADVITLRIPASVIDIAADGIHESTELLCIPGSYAADWASGREIVYRTAYSSWTLHMNNGLPEQSITGEVNSPVMLPVPVRNGYTFNGWYRDDTLMEGLIQEEDGSVLLPMEDADLYAAWQLTDPDAAAEVGHLIWEYEDGHILIIGLADNATELVVPETISGCPVTMIASDAFARTDVEVVILPDSVISLGTSVFENCDSLQYVDLGHITHLPARTLMNCVSLISVQLPDTLTKIDENALNGSGLKTLTIPANVRLISESAMRHCTSLKSITVSDSNAWYESRDDVLYDTVDGKLQRYPAAKIGNSYTVEETYGIGAWAFEEAVSLQTVILSNNVYSLGEGAFRASGLTAMPELPAMITRIPDSCFQGCQNMTTALIPEQVKAVGRYAFANCPLKEIEVPSSVSEIGASAFTGNILIKGTDGSAAHTFALEYGLHWETMNGVAVESISIADDIITLERGEWRMIIPQVFPENADLSGLVWMTSDHEVVSVDQTGKLLATGGGRALVQVIAPNGVTALFGVIVEVPVTSLTLNCHEALLPVNGTLDLMASITPSLPTDSLVQWNSSNPETAIVDENGTVTGITNGTVIITATSHNDISDQCEIRVYIPATFFGFASESVRVLLGQEILMEPQIQPENATFSDVLWTVENEAIASFTSDNVLKAHMVGETMVTARTEEGLTAICTIAVCNYLDQMQIDWPENNIFAVHDTLTLHASITPDHLLSDRIKWESSNPDSISVDENGIITFLRPGIAWITATPEADSTMAARFSLICRGNNQYILPATLKVLDEEAFYGIGAELVILPDGAVSIGERAFSQCPNLAEIHIPASVTMIADQAFEGSGRVAIVGSPGSTAEYYANIHGIPFFAE